jgi:hypothetical protein
MKLHALLVAIPTLTRGDRDLLLQKLALQKKEMGSDEAWWAKEARLHSTADRGLAKEGRFQELLDALTAAAQACVRAGIIGREVEAVLNTVRAILGSTVLQEKDVQWLNQPFCLMWQERRPNQPEPLAVGDEPGASFGA